MVLLDFIFLCVCIGAMTSRQAKKTHVSQKNVGLHMTGLGPWNTLVFFARAEKMLTFWLDFCEPKCSGFQAESLNILVGKSLTKMLTFFDANYHLVREPKCSGFQAESLNILVPNRNGRGPFFLAC